MKHQRVLVADDEAAILSVISYKLRSEGLEVITARDGREALELAKSQVPDLLIIDYQMSGLDGLEVCRQLRKESRTAEIPVIMLTARGMDIDQTDLERAGISLLMAKPFSPKEVLCRAQELLSSQHVGQPCG